MQKLSLLQRTVNTAIDLHGGLRVAGRRLGIAASTFVRIRNGTLKDPESKTLDKLGLERIEGLEIHRRKNK